MSEINQAREHLQAEKFDSLVQMYWFTSDPLVNQYIETSLRNVGLCRAPEDLGILRWLLLYFEPKLWEGVCGLYRASSSLEGNLHDKAGFHFTEEDQTFDSVLFRINTFGNAEVWLNVDKSNLDFENPWWGLTWHVKEGKLVMFSPGFYRKCLGEDPYVDEPFSVTKHLQICNENRAKASEIFGDVGFLRSMGFEL